MLNTEYVEYRDGDTLLEAYVAYEGALTETPALDVAP